MEGRLLRATTLSHSMKFTRESSAATGLTRSTATHGVGEVVCAFEISNGGGTSAVGVWAAPAKTAARMREKLAEYAAEGAAWPLCANILDPVRASVVCAGPGQMLEVARWFLANPSLPICKVRLGGCADGAAVREGLETREAGAKLEGTVWCDQGADVLPTGWSGGRGWALGSCRMQTAHLKPGHQLVAGAVLTGVGIAHTCEACVVAFGVVCDAVTTRAVLTGMVVAGMGLSLRRPSLTCPSLTRMWQLHHRCRQSHGRHGHPWPIRPPIRACSGGAELFTQQSGDATDQ